MKKYDFLDRLIAFAGDIILFVQGSSKKFTGRYLYSQLLRSSGSAALNFGESQAAHSKKDYVLKAGIALKELRETDVNLRILKYVQFGGQKRDRLQAENIELIKILTTIIRNKRAL